MLRDTLGEWRCKHLGCVMMLMFKHPPTPTGHNTKCQIRSPCRETNCLSAQIGRIAFVSTFTFQSSIAVLTQGSTKQQRVSTASAKSTRLTLAQHLYQIHIAPKH